MGESISRYTNKKSRGSADQRRASRKEETCEDDTEPCDQIGKWAGYTL